MARVFVRVEYADGRIREYQAKEPQDFKVARRDDDAAEQGQVLRRGDLRAADADRGDAEPVVHRSPEAEHPHQDGGDSASGVRGDHLRLMLRRVVAEHFFMAEVAVPLGTFRAEIGRQLVHAPVPVARLAPLDLLFQGELVGPGCPSWVQYSRRTSVEVWP